MVDYKNVIVKAISAGINIIGGVRILGNTVKDGSGTDYYLLVDADGKLSIRPLTNTDVVTVEQATAASLKATVTQAEKDRTISAALPTGDNNIGDVDVASIAAGANIIGAIRALGNTVKNGSGTDYYLLVDADGKLSIRPLTNTDIVTVEQATAASLKATVTQAEKDRTISAALPAGDNNIGNVDLASAIPAGTADIGGVKRTGQAGYIVRLSTTNASEGTTNLDSSEVSSGTLLNLTNVVALNKNTAFTWGIMSVLSAVTYVHHYQHTVTGAWTYDTHDCSLWFSAGSVIRIAFGGCTAGDDLFAYLSGVQYDV